MPDEFLTVAEIAELLKLNLQTVRNWIDRGELPAVRVGSRLVRVRRSDLDRYLEASPTSVPAVEPSPAVLEEDSVTAWAAFGAAMAEATATHSRAQIRVSCLTCWSG